MSDNFENNTGLADWVLAGGSDQIAGLKKGNGLNVLRRNRGRKKDHDDASRWHEALMRSLLRILNKPAVFGNRFTVANVEEKFQAFKEEGLRRGQRLNDNLNAIYHQMDVIHSDHDLEELAYNRA